MEFVVENYSAGMVIGGDSAARESGGSGAQDQGSVIADLLRQAKHLMAAGKKKWYKEKTEDLS